LAIKDLLELPSEIEQTYGLGLIFGGSETQEPDEEIYPFVECVVSLV
jgi:hypothetical protein